MPGRSRLSLAAAVTLVAAAAPRLAAGEPLEVGAFFGPRFFSDDAELGAAETVRTTLDTSVAFGPRIARPLFGWLVPEAELALSPATTREHDVSVLWLEPRVQARFVWPEGQVRPFAVLGVGVPMTASEKRGIYASDVSWEGYGGIGAQFSPGRGLSFRVDVRVGVTDGFQDPVTGGSPVAIEVEALAGLYVELGRDAPVRRRLDEAPRPGPRDRDGDELADDADRCPDRPEDLDGFEDGDGCPDIDNDLDRVLDIADACPAIPETYNGFDDEDGCQDTVPSDLGVILGTVEGLLYNPGLTEVRGTADQALARIVTLLEKYPSVRIVVVGHTDDREAEIEAIEGEPPEEAAARQEAALVELARERAAAVADALVERGIPRGRIVVDGAGVAEAVSDNESPRGRLRNRRVELRLFVPVR